MRISLVKGINQRYSRDLGNFYQIKDNVKFSKSSN